MRDQHGNRKLDAIQSAVPQADGARRVVSRRLQFVEVDHHDAPELAGSAPYLDYRPPSAEETELLGDVANASWLADVEQRVLAHAIATAVPEHLADVRARTLFASTAPPLPSRAGSLSRSPIGTAAPRRSSRRSSRARSRSSTQVARGSGPTTSRRA